MADEFNFDGAFGIPVPSGLMRALAEMMGGSDDPIKSENPEDYPEFVEIEGMSSMADLDNPDDVISMLKRYEHMLEQVALLCNERDELSLTAKALMKRIYRTLDKKYPIMAALGDLEKKHSGLRKWKGKYYFIAWKTSDKPTKPDVTG